MAVRNSTLKSPWITEPVYGDLSTVSPTWLWVTMPLMLVAVVAALLLGASRFGALRVRRVQDWRSASGGVHDDDQYTPFGYANASRRILGAVLLTRTCTTRLTAHTGTRVEHEPGAGIRSTVTGVVLG
ncbi:hypothetical protein [Streptomyces sp. NBC_00996]|uniref:hypothetical protein n=1 Tax=Streptomyces sp. NBC_00996 TaxID=2903710 RepID=UPI003864B6B7|nr:hypothetical protein OG390_44125 [Streptomyces sp. NBC_00996]